VGPAMAYFRLGHNSLRTIRSEHWRPSYPGFSEQNIPEIQDLNILRQWMLRDIPASWGSEWDCTQATMSPSNCMSDVVTYQMVEVLVTGIVTSSRENTSSLTMNSSYTSRN